MEFDELVLQICFKGDHVTLFLSLFPGSNFNEVFFMLGITYIQLVFGYLYFPPNTFPKVC